MRIFLKNIFGMQLRFYQIEFLDMAQRWHKENYKNSVILVNNCVIRKRL